MIVVVGEGNYGKRPGLLSLIDFIKSSVFIHRIIFLICAIVLTFTCIYKSRPRRESSTRATFSVQAPSLGYVRISGDVRHAGIYPILANTMTLPVIKMAAPLSSAMDGLSEGEAVESIVNGMSLQITVRPNGTLQLKKSLMSATERLIMGIPLDINSMTEADFDKVPGIGPKMARMIVSYRQFNGGSMKATDLICIEGIGEKKFKHLLNYF